MRGDRRAFDLVMFGCHCISVTNQLLYHTSLVPVTVAAWVETWLFVVKWLLEWRLDAITPDLVAHHVGMCVGSAFVMLQFPSQASVLVHLQAVHLPLAIHYARRLDGAALGSALDEAFACMWLFVVCARGALMTGVAYRLVSTQGDARYVQPPLALLMVALDTVWTRETFERRKVSSTGLVAAAVGLPVGLTSDGESRLTCAVWTALCAFAIVASAPVAVRAGSAWLHGTASERRYQSQQQGRAADQEWKTTD